MPEDSVIQKLGQPIRTVKVGGQKILKFKEMTVVTKDGKVVLIRISILVSRPTTNIRLTRSHLLLCNARIRGKTAQ